MKWVSVAVLALFLVTPVQAADHDLNEGTLNKPAPLNDRIKIDQKLGVEIPKDLTFLNDEGTPVSMGQFFDGKKGPVVLALVYHSCANLCSMVLGGIFRSLSAIHLERGKEFSVVAVSINPDDTPESAKMAKRRYLKSFMRSDSGTGVFFLTGDQASITRLADTVGFRYEYDKKTKQYAHPGALMVITPEGKLSKYFFGVDFPEKDLRFALIEASNRKIGSVIDHFLLYCYHYDPTVGRYGLMIVKVLRAAGVATLLLLGFLIFVLTRKGSWGKPPKTGEALR